MPPATAAMLSPAWVGSFYLDSPTSRAGFASNPIWTSTMGTFHLAERTPPANSNTSLFHKATRMLPGIIAGAADLDPAAVLTATVAGASFGTSLGWVGVLCVPVLFSVFAVSSRIGHETRKRLVELIHERYRCRRAANVAFLIVAVNLSRILGGIGTLRVALSLR